MAGDLRIRGLAGVDPTAVPLPAGTEVGTRVDRMVGERRVPQGAVGRVVAVAGDVVDVKIVGVGVVRYARAELVPRKQGQLAYAARRASAWEALRGCVVLEATVGSRAWGLADAGSDTDVRGVFAWPLSWSSSLAEPATDLVSEDGSTTYWEIGKTIRQALRADPNTLETLFVKSVRATDPIGEWLIAERDAFVSVEIYGTFGRYAVGQLERLTHMLRLAEHRSVVMEWLRAEPAPDLDEVGRRLGALSPRAGVRAQDAEALGKEYVKQLYRSLYDQGVLPAREFSALIELARAEGASFEVPRELRPKNAYHLIRLIHTAIEWLKTGVAELEVRGPLRDTLLSIKRGELPLAEVVRLADALTPELEAARQASQLPRRADVVRADALLRRVREEVARRAVAREPGPLGADAPAPPEVAWAED